MAEPTFRLTHRLPRWIGHPASLTVLTVLFAAALVALIRYMRAITDYLDVNGVVLRWVVVLALGWLLVAAVLVHLRSSRP